MMFLIFNNISLIILLSVLGIIPISLFSQTQLSSSNLPIVVVETNGESIKDSSRIIAFLGIISNDNGKRNYIVDSYNNYSGKISIEIRGSSSQHYAKKSYGFETKDAYGKSWNVPLLGLPEENDWILQGPYSDKTLIRNILTYKLHSNLGHYASRTRLCELVINDSYQGVYVLMEKIKRDKNRVNISKLTSDELVGDDLTGGYILKIDQLGGSNCEPWQTKYSGLWFQVEYPKCDKIVDEQMDYIFSYLIDFEESLSSDQFADHDTGYRKYINVNSFVDYLIINEVSKNVDGYFLSVYFFKDKESKGGKFTMGPVWDYNASFGNAEYRDSYKIHGFQINKNYAPWWWYKILQDSLFNLDVYNRWHDIRSNQFSDYKIISLIDSLALLLDESQKRNFERWPILGEYIWPNYFIGETYKNEIDYLKQWTLDRLSWLDLA